MFTRFALVMAVVMLMSGACSKEPAQTLATRGAELAENNGCLSCHTTDGSESVAPTWKGLYGSKVELSDGTTVTADDDYLARSILDPSAQTVKGFPEGLMATVIKPNSLDDDEVAALIAYIRSLR